MTQLEEGFWSGHIGFVVDGKLATLDWDDKLNDFIRGEASSGTVIPFLISIRDENCLVSFQLIPGEVRPNTVTKNLQSLLNKEGTYCWTIDPLSFRSTLKQWLRSVNRISKFNVRLTPPNPDWTGREQVKGLVEGLNAKAANIIAKAGNEGSIDTDSDWFRQAMDHVRQGYGKLVLDGSDNRTGDTSRFIETDEGGIVRGIDRVSASDDEVEVTAEDLRQAQDKTNRTKTW